MLVFIDDSGDPGFKLDKGSSKHFVIAIRLDGHEDRTYKQAAKTYFRQQANPRGGVIKDLKFVNSKNDNLIQLADMVAGSVMKTTQTGRDDSRTYIKVIQRRVEDIWHFQ